MKTPACPYCHHPQSREISHENGISRYQCIVCCETFVQFNQSPGKTKTQKVKKETISQTTKRCFKCKNPVDINANFCPNCNTILSVPGGEKTYSKTTNTTAKNTISTVPKCKTCGKDVAKSAKACPHCGEKDPHNYQAMAMIGCIPLIIFVVIIFNLSSCLFPSKPSSGSTRSSSTGTSSSSSSSSNYDHEIKAIAFAEQYVKEELSPRVASFPWMDRPHASKVSGHTNRWSVKSYVDTQNTYGAKLRLKYECVMDIRIHGETATLVYLRWLD